MPENMHKQKKGPQTKPSDLDRLRKEYAQRKQRFATTDIYTQFNLTYLFTVQGRKRDTIKLLRQHGVRSLEQMKVLEVGCGTGGVLMEFLAYGAESKDLHGCDLLPDRLFEAQRRVSHLPLCCADGQSLPYPAHHFDLIVQYTVFSSILDENIKRNLAQEMLRVLKSSGLILWYDFWLNPTNPQTSGIRPLEIRRLFPACDYTFRKITLAPPIARRLVHISWLLAFILEKLSVFNSHYLVAIRKGNR